MDGGNSWKNNTVYIYHVQLRSFLLATYSSLDTGGLLSTFHSEGWPVWCYTFIVSVINATQFYGTPSAASLLLHNSKGHGQHSHSCHTILPVKLRISHSTQLDSHSQHIIWQSLSTSHSSQYHLCHGVHNSKITVIYATHTSLSPD